MFARKGEIRAGHATDGFFGRALPHGALHGSVEQPGDLAGKSRFEDSTVGEVAVEGIGCELERGREGAQGQPAKALFLDLLDGGREDRLPVGLGGVRHGYHCTS